MDEKDEENDETSSIIKHASKPPISTDSSKSEPQSFNITPKELSNLMNLYKDRQGNYNDIK